MKKEEETHGGHRERLKSRYDHEGLDGFEPHNALELLLFYAIPRVDTNVIAHCLIEEFGSFSAVLEAPKEELMKVKGIGSSAASFLRMIPDYARYYSNESGKKGIVFDNTSTAGDFFCTKFLGFTKEIIYLACLDSKCKLLFHGKIGEGSVNATSVGIRLIAEQAMRVGAVSVMLAHNHPGGFALPSQQDISSTLKIRAALAPLEIQLLDHFIVADGDYTSMADSGLL